MTFTVESSLFTENQSSLLFFYLLKLYLLHYQHNCTPTNQWSFSYIWTLTPQIKMISQCTGNFQNDEVDGAYTILRTLWSFWLGVTLNSCKFLHLLKIKLAMYFSELQVKQIYSGIDINGCPISRVKWNFKLTCLIG